MNYDNFFLPAENFEESKQFFAEVLKLKIKFDFSEIGMIAFSVGDEEPAIILKDKKKFPNTKQIYDELQGKGVSFLSPPFPIRTGWAIEFLDPSGNVLGFTDYKVEK